MLSNMTVWVIIHVQRFMFRDIWPDIRRANSNQPTWTGILVSDDTDRHLAGAVVLKQGINGGLCYLERERGLPHPTLPYTYLKRGHERAAVLPPKGMVTTATEHRNTEPRKPATARSPISFLTLQGQQDGRERPSKSCSTRLELAGGESERR